MSTLPKDRSPLLPDRHPTPDFFVCDIFDAAASPRGDMASMEHPVFSLSTKPDYRVRKYENNGNFIEVNSTATGTGTMMGSAIGDSFTDSGFRFAPKTNASSTFCNSGSGFRPSISDLRSFMRPSPLACFSRVSLWLSLPVKSRRRCASPHLRLRGRGLPDSKQLHPGRVHRHRSDEGSSAFSP